MCICVAKKHRSSASELSEAPSERQATKSLIRTQGKYNAAALRLGNAVVVIVIQTKWLKVSECGTV